MPTYFASDKVEEREGKRDGIGGEERFLANPLGLEFEGIISVGGD
jgi:hypothetical protein